MTRKDNEEYVKWRNLLISKKISRNKSKRIAAGIVKAKLTENEVENLIGKLGEYVTIEQIKLLRKKLDDYYSQIVTEEKLIKKEEQRKKYELEQKEAVLKQKNFFNNLIKVGVFKHGFLIGFVEGYNPTKEELEYINVELNNSSLNYFLETDYAIKPKFIKIVNYNERRYYFDFEITFVKVDIPLKLYTLNYKWEDINNSFIQCVLSTIYSMNGNDMTSIKWRRLSYVLYNIDALLNPDYPVIYPRTTHSAIILYKQGLVSLKDLYNKTTDEFKLAWEELLSHFELNEEFYDKTGNSRI